MGAKEKYIFKYFFIIVILITIVIGLIILQKNEKVIYAYEEKESEEVTISNAVKVNLDEIIQKNTKQNEYREEILVHQEELEYITKYRNNDSIYIGKTEVSQEGRNGVQAITTKKVYDETGKLIKEEQVSAKR